MNAILLQDISKLEHNLWVTIVTTLFILSLISERLANLIKLYFQSFYEDTKSQSGARTDSAMTQRPKEQRKSKPGRFFGNLRYRQKDPELEKQREKGVQTVAVICGILVCLCSGADLFHLIQTGKTLDWQYWFKYNDVSCLLMVFSDAKMFAHALGVVFAGLFVSLGSKFWHDILDFVLYSSNLKRKLGDDRTFQSTRIEEVDEWLAMYPGDLGNRAYDQYAASLGSQENVAYIAVASEYYNGVYQDVVRVYLKDDDDSHFRSVRTLPVRLESNRIVDVPLVIVTGVGDIPKIHGSVVKGMGIGKEGSDYLGTVCCLVEDKGKKNIYFLTCNHVLTEGDLKYFSPKELSRLQTGAEVTVQNKVLEGVWVNSFQTEDFDMALVLASNKDFVKDLGGVSLKSAPHIMTDKDVGNMALKVLQRVDLNEAKSARLTAYHFNKPIPLKYNNGKKPK